MEAPAAHQIRYLNPVTKEIGVKEVSQIPPTLLQCGVAFLRKMFGFDNLAKVNELDVPGVLQQEVRELKLSDFHVNPDDVTGDHHQNNTFPAACLIDNSRVLLKLHEPESEVPEEPTLLTTFLSSGVKVSVHEVSTSLAQRLADAKARNEIILESFIWKCILSLADTLEGKDVGTLHVSPTTFDLRRSGLVLNSSAEQADMMSVTAEAFYTPPEMLMRQPVTQSSISWIVGCLAYELMALEPAFYDRAHSGNPMAVMMGITSGEKPPQPPAHYSAKLRGLVMRCFNSPPQSRPALGELRNGARDTMA